MMVPPRAAGRPALGGAAEALSSFTHWRASHFALLTTYQSGARLHHMDTLTVVLSIRLDPDLHRQLREAADRNYRSLNKQISLILDGWVEQYGAPEQDGATVSWHARELGAKEGQT